MLLNLVITVIIGIFIFTSFAFKQMMWGNLNEDFDWKLKVFYLFLNIVLSMFLIFLILLKIDLIYGTL
jgi:hypothetical protein